MMSQSARPCVRIRVEKYLMTKGLSCLLGVGWSYYSPADALLSGDDSGNLIDMPEPYNMSKFLRQCLRAREVTNPPGKLPLPSMLFSFFFAELDDGFFAAAKTIVAILI